MKIRVIFSEKRRLPALQLARLLADLQHLTIFILYVAENGKFDEFDVFRSDMQEYMTMIVADLPEKAARLEVRPLKRYRLRVLRVTYESPLDFLLGIVSVSATKQ